MSGVDFIVLDIDGGAMLAACLDSIERQSVAPQRIIVLDNGGRTADRGKQAAGERMLWLRSETNLGFAGGVNLAFQHVTAPFVALINNDVVLDEDWLATVLAAMSDAKVAGVQTVIRRDAMTIDGAGVDIADGTYRQTLDPARAWGISATAALYRVSALGKRVFATRFFAYYEDVELSARLHEQGWETRVLPVIKAAHRGSQSAPLLGDRALRLRTRNRYWVARMHRGVGRIGALLMEDAKLLLQGRSSIRGIIEGLCGRMQDDE